MRRTRGGHYVHGSRLAAIPADKADQKIVALLYGQARSKFVNRALPEFPRPGRPNNTGLSAVCTYGGQSGAQIDLRLRVATEESEQMLSGFVRSGKLAGDVQLHTKRPHELVKTVFQLLAAHADFGWQCVAGLNRFEKYS